MTAPFALRHYGSTVHVYLRPDNTVVSVEGSGADPITPKDEYVCGSETTAEHVARIHSGWYAEYDHAMEVDSCTLMEGSGRRWWRVQFSYTDR